MEKAHLKLTDLIKNDTAIITFLIGYYYSLSCYSKIWEFQKNMYHHICICWSFSHRSVSDCQVAPYLIFNAMSHCVLGDVFTD